MRGGRIPDCWLLLLVGWLSCAQAGVFKEPLPPQELRPALEAFARVTGMQLVYSASLSKGKATTGAAPDLSHADTLRQILDGTGLTYELVNTRTVTIVPIGAVPRKRVVRRKNLTWFDPDALVQITGTNLSGGDLIGAEPTMITRDEIRTAGYATVEEVFQGITRNFGAGSGDDLFKADGESIHNSSRGSGVNLRGLGMGSTLVLVNGRRLAPGAADGRFADISSIPLEAIERIDVVTDGGAAVYGADAMGGVVNFVLRDNYAGTESLFAVGQASGDAMRNGRIAHTFGRRWDSGSALLSLQWNNRADLESSDREYATGSDLRRFGGSNFDTLEGNPGTIISAGQTWAIPKGQDGTNLTASDLTAGTANFHNRNAGRDLLPTQKHLSLVSTARHTVNEDLELFADLVLSERRASYTYPGFRYTLSVPDSNPFYVNPTGGTGPVQVAYSFGPDGGLETDRSRAGALSMTLGVARWLSESWRITPYLSVAQSGERTYGGPFVNTVELSRALADADPRTAFNPFGDGSHTSPETLESIFYDLMQDRSTRLRMLNVTAEGALLELPTGDVRLALGADYRKQSLRSLSVTEGLPNMNVRGDRTVMAVYAETAIPLLGGTVAPLGMNEAYLSLAGRYERFSDFGSTFAPQIGLSVRPINRLELRGTWTQLFKTPNLVDLDESRSGLGILPQLDPGAAGSVVPTLVRFGTNADLRAETAETWTAGLKANVSPHLTFDLNYFNINARNRVRATNFSLMLLDDPADASIVTRSPSQEIREAACSRGTFIGMAADCVNAPVAALIDVRLNNLALLRTSGIDFTANYERPMGEGTLGLEMKATYLLEYEQARTADSMLQSFLNSVGNPIDLRVRTQVAYSRGKLDTVVVANYSDGYTDWPNLTRRSIEAWASVDLSITCRLTDSITAALQVNNLFNSEPPFVNNPAGIAYDPQNADPTGRQVEITMRKSW